VTVRTVARHARPACGWPAEPAQWLVSGLGRGWRWVWIVDHDDLLATVAAQLVQFALLATVFLAMVVGSQ
jgi:hypothetical protein